MLTNEICESDDTAFGAIEQKGVYIAVVTTLAALFVISIKTRTEYEKTSSSTDTSPIVLELDSLEMP